MDGRLALRRYLEQRREMGESELMLDTLTAEDALALIAAPAGAVRRAPSVARETAVDATDWRDAFRKTGAEVDAPGKPAIPAETEAPASEPVTGSRAALDSTDDEASPEDGSSPADNFDFDDMTFEKGLVVASPPSEDTGIRKLRSLSSIAETVKDCRRCSLFTTATNPVPGEGNPRARLVCVGEAPGANEDATGRPFVGRAGELLTKILAAVDLPREEVFILNVLKHRPPANRNPLPEEVEACSPYLVRQLELIKPKVIVAFGTFAAQTLLQTKTPIGKLRGMVHKYNGIPLVVTYHPAALLRNPAWKRPTWEDVKLARRILDSAPRA